MQYDGSIADWHLLPPDPVVIESLKASASGHPSGFQANPHYKRALLEILDRACSMTYEYPRNVFSGRGIVIAASAKSGRSSGKNLIHGHFPGAWATISELRRLGCTLPICLSYLGFEELDAHLAQIVEPLGVTTFDLRWLDWHFDPMRILAGWETKIYAIANCPYEEVLFLDGDNLPVNDPTYLFDDPTYRAYGSIFWPDLPPNSRPEWLPKEVWDSIGMPMASNYIDFESGQLLINKRACWKEIQICRLINEFSDYWYKLVFGDKSTFHLAWNKIGTSYGMPSTPAGWAGKAILQYDMHGELLFQHCCQDKPSLRGYQHSGYLRHERHAISHIKDLASKWDGHLWHWGSSTVRERELMRSLSGTYEYERQGLGARKLELRSDGTIGIGVGGCESTWRVHESPSHGPCIVLYRNDNAPMSVYAFANGEFHGQWLHFEKCRAWLRK